MKFFQLIFILIFCYTALSSQTQLPPNELDNKYTPNGSSIFNNAVKKSYDKNSYDEIEFIQVVKYCPTMLARQKVCFLYERSFAKGFVATGGLGKAFGRDIFQDGFFVLGLSRFSNNSVLSPEDALSNSTYLSSRPLVQLGAKYYFNNVSFEEAYFEINYRRERMTYLLEPTINSIRVDGENDVVFKMNGFSMGFGITILGGTKNNIVNELFLNFGIKTIRFTQYDALSVLNPISNRNDLIYRRTNEYLNTRIVPTINVGYSIGFGW